MFQDFFELLFPECCLACGRPLLKHEELLCTSCHLELPVTDYHLYPENELSKRFEGRVALQYTLAYLNFVQKGKAQAIIHSLKYKGREEAGLLMGQWYGEKLRQHQYHTHFDMVVPVPLHRKKFKKRGYNQAASFSGGMAQALHIEHIPNLLVRKVFTDTQTRKKIYDRWLNVEDIFMVDEAFHKKCSGKHVLLVDDVLTTGSTLESCAQALLKVASKVSIGAIAAA